MVLSTTDVLKVISDKESLELFRTVALGKQDTDNLISKSKAKLTRKQYYSRMSKLMKAGLIQRKNGKHTLTAFGKIIYNIVQIKIENAVNNYWKLKTIDLLEDFHTLSTTERKKIIYDGF
jgi:predicted transcriptional regulator